jgi:septum formation protein
MNKLILASSSEYRRAMLQRLGLEFSCYAADIDETGYPAENATQLAARLASEKARQVAELFPEAMVIGCDQTAELNGLILGKPGNHQQATEQLAMQSGNTVLFHSALTVLTCSKAGEIKRLDAIDTTRVNFRQLTLQQIDRYLLIDQPYDCAGSFKAESLGISLFSSVESNDPSSLIGLPLIALCSMLEEFGLPII